MNPTSINQSFFIAHAPRFKYAFLARRPDDQRSIATQSSRKIEVLASTEKPGRRQAISNFFQRVIQKFTPRNAKQVEAAKLRRTDEVNRQTAYFVSGLQQSTVTPESFEKLVKASHLQTKSCNIQSVKPLAPVLAAFENQWPDDNACDYQDRVHSILSALASDQCIGYLENKEPEDARVVALLTRMAKFAVTRFLQEEPEAKYSDASRNFCRTCIDKLRNVIPLQIQEAETDAHNSEKYLLARMTQEEAILRNKTADGQNQRSEQQKTFNIKPTTRQKRQPANERAKQQKLLITQRNSNRFFEDLTRNQKIAPEIGTEGLETREYRQTLLDNEKNRLFSKHTQTFLADLTNGQDYRKSFIALAALSRYDNQVEEQMQRMQQNDSDVGTIAASDSSDVWEDHEHAVGKTSSFPINESQGVDAHGSMAGPGKPAGRMSVNAQAIAGAYKNYLNEKIAVRNLASEDGDMSFSNPAAEFLRPTATGKTGSANKKLQIEKVQSTNRLLKSLEMLSSKPALDLLQSTDDYRISARQVLHAMAAELELSLREATHLKLKPDQFAQLDRLNRICGKAAI